MRKTKETMTQNFKGTKVTVKDFENINQALRRLKKKVSESGKLEEAKRRKHYEKPSDVKTKEKAAAKLRWQKKVARSKPKK